MVKGSQDEKLTRRFEWKLERVIPITFFHLERILSFCMYRLLPFERTRLVQGTKDTYSRIVSPANSVPSNRPGIMGK